MGLAESYQEADRLDLARETYEEMGWLDLARETYEKVVEDQPAFQYARARYGYVLYELGEYVAAITHLEEAHRLDPTDGRTLSNLGLAYDATEERERARALFGQWTTSEQKVTLKTNFTKFAPVKHPVIMFVITTINPENCIAMVDLYVHARRAWCSLSQE